MRWMRALRFEVHFLLCESRARGDSRGKLIFLQSKRVLREDQSMFQAMELSFKGSGAVK